MLILHLDSRTFRISDSERSGTIYIWTPIDDLGWSEGDTVQVRLDLITVPNEGDLTIAPHRGNPLTHRRDDAIDEAGDRDIYAVQLEAGKFYSFGICGCLNWWGGDIRWTREEEVRSPEIRLLDFEGQPVADDEEAVIGRQYTPIVGSRFEFEPNRSGPYYVEVFSRDPNATGRYGVWVSDLTRTESSPDEGSGSENDFGYMIRPGHLHPGDPISGNLNSDGHRWGFSPDSDFFLVNLKAGYQYTFNYSGDIQGTDLQGGTRKHVGLVVSDPISSQPFAHNYPGWPKTLTFTAPHTGEYFFYAYVTVRDANGSSAYTITMTERNLSLGAPLGNQAPTGKPSIAGTAEPGQVLAADTSAISDPNGMIAVSFRYQWVRNDGATDAEISGATGSTYTVVEEDVGYEIKVRVTFEDDLGYQETVTSPAVYIQPPQPLYGGLRNGPTEHDGAKPSP